MRFEIIKLVEDKQVAWNGTLEDLEGFKIRVYDGATSNTFNGRVVNGKAVSNRRFDLLMVAKALIEFKGGNK